MTGLAWAGLSVSAGAVAAAAWGHFEAGWVRLKTLDVQIPALPEALAGLRIAHLSDFHLGLPSRGRRAVEDAVAWVEASRPDLVFVTGDLVSRPRGEPILSGLLQRLPRCYAVLGNHDVDESRDPFSRPAELRDFASATLLVDEADTLDVNGCRIQIVGVDPRSYKAGRSEPWRLADPDADFRILLCHYPTVLSRVPPGSFHLVLAGHMHDGQIALPYVYGKLRLAHPSAPFWTGVYTRGKTTMHVSPGLGTTFVPFRFFARPEATELVLQRA
jgi:predicted MPP superfamily phosphohydrolase